MDWAMTTAIWDDKHLSFGIWYLIFDILWVITFPRQIKSVPCLLVHWRCMLSSHQQPRCWPHNMDGSLSPWIRVSTTCDSQVWRHGIKCIHTYFTSWWHHEMETFSALLAICAGNSPVPSEFPTQRPVTRSFGVFFDLRLNKRLSKKSRGWWFETPSRPLWRHHNV